MKIYSKFFVSEFDAEAVTIPLPGRGDNNLKTPEPLITVDGQTWTESDLIAEGYIKVDGQWRTEVQLAQLGYTKQNGEWVNKRYPNIADLIR